MKESLNVISAAEFRNMQKHPQRKSMMSAEEWRAHMKKKKSTNTNVVGEIRLMLQLARIAFVEEYRFHQTRRWRFDFAIPERMIAIEYEGVQSRKSRHTTLHGYTGDADKYNAAQLMGWKVLRYTVKNYKQVMDDLE